MGDTLEALDEAPIRRKGFHWHEPNTSKEEKWLIRKLDFFILTYGCLVSFFVKYLDQTNISNAYVSGMKEELGLGGNQLNKMTTWFNVGVIIGAPFSNLILTVVRPRIWLPTCLLSWSLFVLFLYKCQSAEQIYILRFFCGLFESAAFPGIHYVIGSWYRKSELGRRSALFVISGVLGQMFSGYLQSALYTGMNGRLGLSAWRWLFIFDFIIAIPIAIYGLVCFPDTPTTTKAWWLTPWETNRAIERIAEEGRMPHGKLDWSALKRIFRSWQLYVFCIAWSFWSLTCGNSVMTWMELWLKAEKYPDGTSKYSVPQINNIPTGVGAVNFFFMIGTGAASDYIGTRAPVMGFVGIVLTFCYIIYVIWDVPLGLRFTAFFLTGCYGCFSPLLAGWANALCGGDSQLRAFTIAMMVSLGSAFSTPFSQYMFPASDAPKYRQTHGYPAALVFVIALTVWTSLVMGWFDRFYNKSVKAENRGNVESDNVDETAGGKAVEARVVDI